MSCPKTVADRENTQVQTPHRKPGVAFPNWPDQRSITQHNATRRHGNERSQHSVRHLRQDGVMFFGPECTVYVYEVPYRMHSSLTSMRLSIAALYLVGFTVATLLFRSRFDRVTIWSQCRLTEPLVRVSHFPLSLYLYSLHCIIHISCSHCFFSGYNDEQHQHPASPSGIRRRAAAFS